MTPKTEIAIKRFLTYRRLQLIMQGTAVIGVGIMIFALIALNDRTSKALKDSQAEQTALIISALDEIKSQGIIDAQQGQVLACLVQLHISNEDVSFTDQEECQHRAEVVQSTSQPSQSIPQSITNNTTNVQSPGNSGNNNGNPQVPAEQCAAQALGVCLKNQPIF